MQLHFKKLGRAPDNPQCSFAAPRYPSWIIMMNASVLVQLQLTHPTCSAALDVGALPREHAGKDGQQGMLSMLHDGLAASVRDADEVQVCACSC